MNKLSLVLASALFLGPGISNAPTALAQQGPAWGQPVYVTIGNTKYEVIQITPVHGNSPTTWYVVRLRNPSGDIIRLEFKTQQEVEEYLFPKKRIGAAKKKIDRARKCLQGNDRKRAGMWYAGAAAELDAAMKTLLAIQFGSGGDHLKALALPAQLEVVQHLVEILRFSLEEFRGTVTRIADHSGPVQGLDDLSAQCDLRLEMVRLHALLSGRLQVLLTWLGTLQGCDSRIEDRIQEIRSVLTEVEELRSLVPHPG